MLCFEVGLFLQVVLDLKTNIQKFEFIYLLGLWRVGFNQINCLITEEIGHIQYWGDTLMFIERSFGETERLIDCLFDHGWTGGEKKIVEEPDAADHFEEAPAYFLHSTSYLTQYGNILLLDLFKDVYMLHAHRILLSPSSLWISLWTSLLEHLPLLFFNIDSGLLRSSPLWTLGSKTLAAVHSGTTVSTEAELETDSTLTCRLLMHLLEETSKKVIQVPTWTTLVAEKGFKNVLCIEVLSVEASRGLVSTEFFLRPESVIVRAWCWLT